jgi:D-alanyl-D-alanine carboxypeptidase
VAGKKGHYYTWTNTNKLLEHGYSGLKTGITPTAGPCLAASIQKDDYRLIIVVLNSKSMEHRWQEVQKLVSWAIQKINKVKDSELKPKVKKQMLKKLVHI